MWEVFIMFIIIVNFPPIKEGKESEFLEWFTWTNEEFVYYKGFISRRLLKSPADGNYAAIVEYESQDTFLAMQNSPSHTEASMRVGPLLDGSPTPQFFEVVIG